MSDDPYFKYFDEHVAITQVYTVLCSKCGWECDDVDDYNLAETLVQEHYEDVHEEQPA